MQDEYPVNRTEGPTDWQTVNWRKANRAVSRLRQRIFRATQEGNWDKVQSLQRLMLRSYSNRLVAVRRVTQINQGKRTPGVDKVVIKSPTGRGRLVDMLADYQPWRAKPARRVYIPKANGKQRPLGIPTVMDRTIQAIVKNALEPAWEAQFESSSYGFRPGRGCHDALDRIYTIAGADKRRHKRWVVDADIKGAFDNINHEYLLSQLEGFPAKELVKQWLKAGYMEKFHFHPTEAGTPQGGVISPLLANIALHGMEKALGIRYKPSGGNPTKRALVRYADDFVVFTESKEDAENVRDNILIPWLAKRGLEISPEKTRIVHLTEGFDFLGFTVKHYEENTSASGWKLLIQPSKKSLQEIRDRLRREWEALTGHNMSQITKRLNPIIRGMANYYRRQAASKAFKKLDAFMFHREGRYAARTHPQKSWKWRQRRYWGRLNKKRKDNYVFGDKGTGAYVLKFVWFPIERHVVIKGTASPDVPTLRAYWEERRQKQSAKGHPQQLQRLITKQKGLCPICGDNLENGEELQKHHLTPRHKGGNDDDANMGLVHLYCHQQAHGNPKVLTMTRERVQQQ